MMNVAGAAIIHGGEILLVRERSNTGFWIFPGGRLEEGETPEECLVREIGEELPGLRFQPKNFRLLGVYPGLIPNGDGEIQLTVYRVLRAGRLFKMGVELQETMFTDKSESFNLAEATRRAIAALRQ